MGISPSPSSSMPCFSPVVCLTLANILSYPHTLSEGRRWGNVTGLSHTIHARHAGYKHTDICKSTILTEIIIWTITVSYIVDETPKSSGLLYILFQMFDYAKQLNITRIIVIFWSLQFLPTSLLNIIASS